MSSIHIQLSNPQSLGTGECHATCGIDSGASLHTPSGKVVRVDVSANDYVTFCNLNLATLLSFIQPIQEGEGKLVPVSTDFTASFEIRLVSVPGHADNNFGVHKNHPDLSEKIMKQGVA